MDIQGISNSLLTSQVNGLGRISGQGQIRQSGGMPMMGNLPQEVDGLDMSKPGEMFSQLQKLQTSDPAKFKQTVSDIADTLEKASKDQTGFGGGMLSDMASKFRDVANGGDLSQVKPPDPFASMGNNDPIGQYKMQDMNSSLESLLLGNTQSSGSNQWDEIISNLFQQVNKTQG